jgi:hypothetical protein
LEPSAILLRDIVHRLGREHRSEGADILLATFVAAPLARRFALFDQMLELWWNGNHAWLGVYGPLPVDLALELLAADFPWAGAIGPIQV